MELERLVTAGYALTALLCFWLAARERRETRTSPRYPAVWILLGLTLALLCGNEIFGWLGQLTQDERGRAYLEGWYAQRRDLQWRLLTKVPAAAVLMFVIGLILVRRAWPRYFLAIGALIYSVGDAFVQALSFHAVDKIMGQTWHGHSFWIWAKILGIGLAALAVVPTVATRRGLTQQSERTESERTETGDGQWV